MLLYLICLYLFSSCNSNKDESVQLQLPNDQEVVVVENFNHTGVNFKIQNMGLTRAGVFDSYYLEAEMPNKVVLEAIVNVEMDISGNRIISLFQTADYLSDDIFIGSYTVDEALRIIDAEVGDYTEDYNLQLLKRQPGEKYWSCVKREYKALMELLSERPIDDIVCDIIAPTCKVLALMSASYECWE